MTDAARPHRSWAHAVQVAVDVRLHVLEWVPASRQRRDVLLVHGLASNAQLWTGLAEVLVEEGHRVVAVDQRGHGLSDKPDEGYDFTTLVQDLLAVLDALGLEHPVAVGQSWGGNVVLELGRQAPDRVAGIACVDGGQIELSSGFADEQAMLEILRPPPLEGMALRDIDAGMRRRMTTWPESGIRGQLANFVRRPDGTIAPHLTLARHLEILRHLWRHHPSQVYGEVDVPVLLLPVAGGPDAMGSAKRDAIAAAESGLRTSRTHWFESSHDIHAEDPQAVAAVLRTAFDDGFFPEATG